MVADEYADASSAIASRSKTIIMERTHTLLLCFLLLGNAALAQPPICNPQGNVVLYSNYDGGLLNIVVDENIPDLHIGIVSYEFVRVNVTGAFASNIVAIWYAGYDADNDHCSIGGTTFSTTIAGAPPGTDQIAIYPAATWANANGSTSMVCNYTCDINTSQGGCNTADQTAHYFLSQWGGVLRFHLTQYGCWTGQQLISSGGNCCEDPLSTTVLSNDVAGGAIAYPNPAVDRVVLDTAGPVEVTDALGRVVLLQAITSGAGSAAMDVRALPNGTYHYRIMFSGAVGRLVVRR